MENKKQQAIPKKKPRNTKNINVCFLCGKEGHYAANHIRKTYFN